MAWMWRDLAGLTFLEGATGRSRLQEEVRSSRRLAEQFIRSMWTREGVGVGVGSTETGCTVHLRLGAVGYCYCYYCISRRTMCCSCRRVSRDLNQPMCLQSPPVEHGSSVVDGRWFSRPAQWLVPVSPNLWTLGCQGKAREAATLLVPACQQRLTAALTPPISTAPPLRTPRRQHPSLSTSTSTLHSAPRPCQSHTIHTLAAGTG